MLSGPDSLPLLICLMVMLSSSIVDGPTLIGRSVGVASMLGGFNGAGRFKSSLKCSTHLFRCSPMLMITLCLPCFSLVVLVYDNFQRVSLLCHTIVPCFLLLFFPPSS
ncbi:unnamed protein product, partial [Schistosoma mattheei]